MPPPYQSPSQGRTRALSPLETTFPRHGTTNQPRRQHIFFDIVTAIHYSVVVRPENDRHPRCLRHPILIFVSPSVCPWSFRAHADSVAMVAATLPSDLTRVLRAGCVPRERCSIGQLRPNHAGPFKTRLPPAHPHLNTRCCSVSLSI